MKQIIVNNIRTTYYITEEGRCFNEKTNKFLKGQIMKNGYLSYQITLPSGEKKRLYAHRLVAQAFLEEKKDKKEVNHKDGNKLNNYIDNLEWVNSSENKIHAIKNGLRKYSHVYCFTRDKKLVAEYLTIQEAAKAVGITWQLIQQELQKEIKTLTGGFYWSYEKELCQTKDYPNLGKAKEVYQYDLKGKFIQSYPSTGIAAKAINGVNSHIGECCRGKLKQYKGFVWRYAEDIVSPSVKTEENIANVVRKC